ncbi:unnamed protein product [Trichogramma brassicae]|uniref:Uncharacterized protein n=1 Tax=Trichogramma brassicae TaxID=86971 RepID=A0A6H5IXZ9_9HYME|nr:unnamed protein product [Trichogramma brassicae]
MTRESGDSGGATLSFRQSGSSYGSARRSPGSTLEHEADRKEEKREYRHQVHKPALRSSPSRIFSYQSSSPARVGYVTISQVDQLKLWGCSGGCSRMNDDATKGCALYIPVRMSAARGGKRREAAGRVIKPPVFWWLEGKGGSANDCSVGGVAPISEKYRACWIFGGGVVLSRIRGNCPSRYAFGGGVIHLAFGKFRRRRFIADSGKLPVSMGELPDHRVIGIKCFVTSGVDYAGPVRVSPSRGKGIRSIKAYICLFICTSTKALHLEVVSDMTSSREKRASVRAGGRAYRLKMFLVSVASVCLARYDWPAFGSGKTLIVPLYCGTSRQRLCVDAHAFETSIRCRVTLSLARALCVSCSRACQMNRINQENFLILPKFRIFYDKSNEFFRRIFNFWKIRIDPAVLMVPRLQKTLAKSREESSRSCVTPATRWYTRAVVDVVRKAQSEYLAVLSRVPRRPSPGNAARVCT